MGRTRLRGMEVAGVRVAIEVPSTLPWEWDGTGLEPYACQPIDPEVHVGVRIGATRPPSGQTFFYDASGSRFEVGNEGSDWIIATHGHGYGGGCERTARFDESFSHAEVTLSPEFVARGRYPLHSPLDELLILHRVVRMGCLVLRGTIRVEDGQAAIFLPRESGRDDERRTPGLAGSSQHLVLRPISDGSGSTGEIQVRTMPWGAPTGGDKVDCARLRSIHIVESGAERPIERLSVNESINEVLQHAFAPVHDPEVAERVFSIVEKIVRSTPVERIGRPAMRNVVSFTWDQSPATFGFASPGS